MKALGEKINKMYSLVKKIKKLDNNMTVCSRLELHYKEKKEWYLKQHKVSCKWVRLYDEKAEARNELQDMLSEVAESVGLKLVNVDNPFAREDALFRIECAYNKAKKAFIDDLLDNDYVPRCRFTK